MKNNKLEFLYYRCRFKEEFIRLDQKEYSLYGLGSGSDHINRGAPSYRTAYRNTDINREEEAMINYLDKVICTNAFMDIFMDALVRTPDFLRWRKERTFTLAKFAK